MNHDELDKLEIAVRNMRWEDVQFSPSLDEVRELDRQLPAGWVQTLEENFTQEEVQAWLRAPLQVPENNNINEEARQAISELDLNVEDIIQELDHAPTLELPPELPPDHDWGR
ncbi:hypothetical protein EPA93_43240 [Ktedonosporobacter rubrisoli]|uniref:Uncharacterized protein n=1 Tax=Ktedonosporobacter rubrisoli TaxID=2509675 RepID=A0A4V0Z094_KTERU|nr:hypothetical protein [Ktedonosporobacter rubrisoli]QBD82431.1 hypothetical protein EPA93_43240 [Ktedonosporobacter rubrisoli]